MTTFSIQKKSPATNWHTIYKGFSREDAEDFLKEMGEGGFDQSGFDGTYDLDSLTAGYEDRGDFPEEEGGDWIQYRAIEE